MMSERLTTFSMGMHADYPMDALMLHLRAGVPMAAIEQAPRISEQQAIEVFQRKFIEALEELGIEVIGYDDRGIGAQGGCPQIGQ